MKRLLAALMCVIMALSCTAFAEETAAPVYDYDKLVVGSTTVMSGNFFNEMFGNNTADLDVRALLHGYNLIKWDTEMGGFVTDDTVVSGLSATENEEGDRTYTIALYQDLAYSDGTPITAWDYAFSMLISAAPEMAEIGAVLNGPEAIIGMLQMAKGETEVLSGVRVLNDYLFSVTIDHAYRPFFYEMGLMNFYPYPIQVIAPECIVADDGEGVYIANRAAFNAEVLRETILGENGYLSHPSVVSGPYTLTSFDGTTAEFEINPYFKGDDEGELPHIKNLVFTLVENETMIDQLVSGELGLINKTVAAPSIMAGIQAIASADLAMSSYSRVGLSYVSFCCERPAIASQAVRQAIALCMDKENLVQDYVGGFGLPVDGYYGIGQWMYQLVTGIMPVPDTELKEDATAEEKAEYEEAMKAWEELNLDGLTVYTLDTEAAEELLIADGWTLNEAGTEYQKGTDRVRCKMMDGELVKLDLKMIYPKGNTMEEAFNTRFIPNLAEAGIVLTIEGVEMSELLNYHYRQLERDTDMIYLATNFTVVYDPSLTYSMDDLAQNVYNTSAIQDEKLAELAVDMRKTEPGDLLTYCQKWVAFQEYWTEVLPAIPIYSNAYFDFYTAHLQDYFISSNATWTQAIVKAYLDDIAEEEPEEEELDDGEFEIFD